jgi:hypothetical protein
MIEICICRRYKNMPKKSTCWVQPLHQLKGLLNLQSLDIYFLEFKLAIKNYLRNKVPDQLKQRRSSNEGTLRFHNNIFSSFDLKDYLKFNLTRSERSLLTKIKVSAHSLAIEAGRYSRPKIPTSERFCKFCKIVMEDEKHFILNCHQYETLRGKYKIFLDVDNDIHSIRKLMNPTKSKSAIEICSFLIETFEINKFDS